MNEAISVGNASEFVRPEPRKQGGQSLRIAAVCGSGRGSTQAICYVCHRNHRHLKPHVSQLGEGGWRQPRVMWWGAQQGRESNPERTQNKKITPTIMKEEKYLSTHLMILYHYVSKVFEAHGYRLIKQSGRDFIFRSDADSSEVSMTNEYDFMTVSGEALHREIAPRLLKENIFTRPDPTSHMLEANLEKPLDNLWAAVERFFSDEEILEIFSRSYGRRRYLDELRRHRRKIDQDFFDPPEDLKASPFI